jgi:transcriptional regulator with XRE-family HTH domain
VNFAKTFQLLRIRYGLTQEQFADQTGLGAISDIETGRREPRIDELEFCAKAFGITVSSLVEFAEQIDDPSVIFPFLGMEKKQKLKLPSTTRSPRMRRTKS